MHPEFRFVQYILQGLEQGFRVGFDRRQPLRSASSNCPSAKAHPGVVSDYIAKETSLWQFLGPFTHDQLPPVHISKFRVIPKGHTPGKWRLITDLSSPRGFSINDGIDPSICSLSYVTVDQIAETAASFRRGALLAKLDVESAYRVVPVHPMIDPY